MATDHQHHHSSHGDDGSGQLNHETTDISLEGVGKLTIGFALILIVVSSVMYGTYRMLDARAVQNDTTIERGMDTNRETAKAVTRPVLMNAPNGIDQVGRPPAGPKLLTNETLWLAEVKATQQQALTTYGWVDKGAGTVRLPIERAKQLIAERGLPKTAAPADATAAGDGAVAPAGDQGGMDATIGTPLPTTTPKATQATGGPRPGSN